MITRSVTRAAACVALFGCQAVGQTVVQQQPHTVGQSQIAQSTTMSSPAETDKSIAGCLMLAHQEQVQLAQFAAERAQNDDVKQFAKQIENAHEKAIDDLTRFAPMHARNARSLSGKGDDGRDSNSDDGTSATNSQTQPLAGSSSSAGQSTTGQSTTGQTVSGSADGQMFAMQKSMATECLKLTMAEMKDIPEDDFDAAFVGSQMGAHIAMLSKLKTAEEFATPSLKTVAEQQTKVMKDHFAEAKKLCKAIDKDNRQAGRDRDQR
ncbi:MAG: DUF4142 domain-containing protein [Lacipirellulaceae bacterium]